MPFDRNIKNVSFIFLSIILGGAFWYYAKTDTTVTTTMKLPLKVIPPPGYVIIKQIPDSITLKLSTKLRTRNILKKVSPIIALEEVKNDEFTEKLKKDILKFPVWLRIKNYEIIESEELLIEMDTSISKKVRVIIPGGVEFVPEEVTIKGPEKMIRNINHVSPDSLPSGNTTTITIKNKFISVKPRFINIVQ